MKPRLNFALVGACSVLWTLAVCGQEATVPPPSAPKDPPPRAIGKDKDKARHLEKVSELIGSEIHTLENEKLGQVDDLAVLLDSSRVVQVVVSFGGLRSVEDKLTTVPPQVLNFDEKTKICRLKADTEKFQSAPRFEVNKWDEAMKSDQIAVVYRHYGEKARAIEVGQAGNPGQSAGRQVERASKMIGAPVKNPQNDTIGKVDNLVVNLERGIISSVILSTGDYLGTPGDLSAVPPAALRYNPQHDTLLLDATKEVLMKVPHFKAAEWPDMSARGYADRIHAPFGLKPSSRKDLSKTRKLEVK